MASISLFVFFVLSHLLLLHSTEEENSLYSYCSPFHCGKFGIIGFPFYNRKYPFCCGLLAVNCDGTPPTIQLEWSGRQYEVINISYTNTIISHVVSQFQKDLKKKKKRLRVVNLNLHQAHNSDEISSLLQFFKGI